MLYSVPCTVMVGLHCNWTLYFMVFIAIEPHILWFSLPLNLIFYGFHCHWASYFMVFIVIEPHILCDRYFSPWTSCTNTLFSNLGFLILLFMHTHYLVAENDIIFVVLFSYMKRLAQPPEIKCWIIRFNCMHNFRELPYAILRLCRKRKHCHSV